MANIDELARSAGIAVDQLPDAQRQVLESLSDDEVRILTSVNERMKAAGADTEGYLAAAGDRGGIFW